MARSVVVRSRVSGKTTRRQTAWLDDTDPAAANALAANGSVLFASLNAAALAFRPFTVVRVRGLLSIISDQLAASEFAHGAIGFAVVSDQAVAAGIASVPTPTLESGSGLWFLHESWSHSFDFATSIGFQQGGQDMFRLDSKAMRKVDLGQDVAIVLENGSSTAGISFVLNFRMLIKTH